jgi:hypothetical protein
LGGSWVRVDSKRECQRAGGASHKENQGAQTTPLLSTD